jgi:hypothetical protein
VTALILDAGAFLAVERDDRTMIARLRLAERHGFDLRSNAVVIGQVWRDPRGRQARMARLLQAVDVRTVTEHDGRAAGELLGASGTSDVVDATVALLARSGDQIITSDPGDIRALVSAAGTAVAVVPC